MGEKKIFDLFKTTPGAALEIRCCSNSTILQYDPLPGEHYYSDTLLKVFRSHDGGQAVLYCTKVTLLTVNVKAASTVDNNTARDCGEALRNLYFSPETLARAIASPDRLAHPAIGTIRCVGQGLGMGRNSPMSYGWLDRSFFLM